MVETKKLCPSARNLTGSCIPGHPGHPARSLRCAFLRSAWRIRPAPCQGGNSDGDSFVFDIAQNRWLANSGGIPDRPHAGDHHSIVAGDGKIHLIGALGTVGARGKVQTLDVAARVWSVDPSPIPNGVHGSVCAARTDDGTIYVCGGLTLAAVANTDGENPRHCYVYTPGAASPWRQIRSMIRGVDHAATGTDGTKVNMLATCFLIPAGLNTSPTAVFEDRFVPTHRLRSNHRTRRMAATVVV